MILMDDSITNQDIFQYLGASFSRRNDKGRLKKLLDKMTKLNPNDWNAWLNYATLSFADGKMDEGYKYIDKAIKIDREQVIRRLWQDPRFNPLRESKDPKIKNKFMEFTK